MRRILLQAIIVTTVVAASVGCATVYTPAPGEPTARLRLVTLPAPKYGIDKGQMTNLWARDLSACPDQPVIVHASNVHESDRVSLRMPAPPDASDKFYTELLIPANKLLGLEARGTDSSGSSHCEVRTRFRPLAGMDYEVEPWWSADGEKCFFKMHTLTTNARGVTRRQPFAPLEPDAYGVVWSRGVVVAGSVAHVIQTSQNSQPDLCQLPVR